MPDHAALAKWGVVSTIKAPLQEVLMFAAHHLEQGAHRLYLYLDAPDAALAEAVNTHPKVRVTQTDARYWDKKGKRPKMHQPRQTINAADAYARRVEVDWLTHIDCDEFLRPAHSEAPSLAHQCAALPADCLCARVRPVEALAWDGALPRPYKSYEHAQPKRQNITRDLYPTYGHNLNGGFLSHVAGKMVYRTGVDGLFVKIHNAFVGEEMNPGQQELPNMHLCHTHGSDWDAWLAHFHYRLSKGAYRADLRAAPGGMTMHELMQFIERDGGETALRAFWEEVCTARPDLLDGLEKHALLHWHSAPDTSLIEKHFPGLG